MDRKSSLGDAKSEAEFDEFADDYDAALNKGLSLTGESKDYFAEGRMRWLKGRLARRGLTPRRALDFGCGTGGSTRWFFSVLGAESLTGVDPSAESLEVARGECASFPVSFRLPEEDTEDGQRDLAFCNGVFHHIPVEDRPAAVAHVFRSLRPGGIFAFWENNAWNPATRFVMSRVSFDRDAILLFPHGARKMLRAGGFEILGTDYLFVFPRPLAALRRFEPMLCKLPLGGQYLVLARKPGG
jgi:SAM-dependent methyltransferase